jgi:hypothetical protein
MIGYNKFGGCPGPMAPIPTTAHEMRDLRQLGQHRPRDLLPTGGPGQSGAAASNFGELY